MRTFVILIVLACSACGSTHELTSCRGNSLAAANPGKWTPSPADLSLKAVAAQ